MKHLRKFLAESKVLRENAKSTSLERHGVLWRDEYTMFNELHESLHECAFISLAPGIQEKMEAMIEVIILAFQETGHKNRALTLIMNELEQIAESND